MANILIIGGSKFIGRTVLQKLSKEGHQLTVLNRGNTEESAYLPKSTKHIIADRNDINSMKESLSKEIYDVIYDICCVTPHHVKILLESLSNKNGTWRVKRHVHVSTGSVYDMSENNVFQIPVKEDHPYPEIDENTHPYVRDKTLAEKELLKAFQERNFPVSIIRPTFVYGPYNYIYREAYFFDRISRDRPLLIPEKGNGFFDLTYVEDLADIIINLGFAPSEKVLGQAFNGSSGFLISGNMFANLVGKIINKSAKIIYYPASLIEELNWPTNHPLFPYVDEGGFAMSALKVERVLGIKPKFDYEHGLRESFKWWAKQQKPDPNFELEDDLIKYLSMIESNDITNSELELARIKEKISKLNESD